jgi:hypothetical protein
MVNAMLAMHIPAVPEYQHDCDRLDQQQLSSV